MTTLAVDSGFQLCFILGEIDTRRNQERHVRSDIRSQTHRSETLEVGLDVADAQVALDNPFGCR
jgi:hypothetical protein